LDYVLSAFELSIGVKLVKVDTPLEGEKPYEDTDSDIDNNGVVLRVSMDKISFLLSADMYWDGELRLVCEQPVLRSTVLKVGHHAPSRRTPLLFQRRQSANSRDIGWRCKPLYAGRWLSPQA
jgi:hypothetical protein